MCSLTKVLNLVPDSALFPAPSLGFVTVVTSSACLFVIMWAASLSLLLPIQNAAAHDIHYLFQLQYIQEKVAENISQPTFFFFFFPLFLAFLIFLSSVRPWHQLGCLLCAFR